MYLYGASGHAKVIINILENNNIKVEGLFDDNPCIKELKGYKCYTFSSFKEEYKIDIIISIGNNVSRYKLVKKIKNKVFFKKVIDKTAIIADIVQIGEGTVIMPGVVINTETQIGEHVILNTSSSIDHECFIDDYSHISPNATLCGNVNIGKFTHIGAGAVILPNINIGNNVTVGAGSVIIKDIEDNCVVVGNPGRIIKYKKNEQ